MVDKHVLIARLSRFFGDDETVIKSLGTRNNIPEKVTSYLKDIVGNLRQDDPDMIRLAASARAVIWWHFDQGFESVPEHMELERVAIDLAKFGTISEVLEKARMMVSPGLINYARVIDILGDLITRFAPDGALDRSEYERLSMELNASIDEDRAAYVRVFGPGIEAI